MNASRTTLTRSLIALAGITAMTTAASAQPGSLRYHGDPVYARPISYERERSAATVWIDGRATDLWECDGVRAGLLEALECAGYDVWCEGSTIVVDISCHEPRIRWDSCDYRLIVRERCGELRLQVRRSYRHHDEIEPPIRGRYRVEEPVLIEPAVHRGGRYEGREAGEYRGREGGRYDDRRERPGNREDDRSYRGRHEDRGPEFRGPPAYETEHFGFGIGIGDDGDVKFDLDAGFFRAGPSAGW